MQSLANQAYGLTLQRIRARKAYMFWKDYKERQGESS